MAKLYQTWTNKVDGDNYWLPRLYSFAKIIAVNLADWSDGKLRDKQIRCSLMMHVGNTDHAKVPLQSTKKLFFAAKDQN